MGIRAGASLLAALFLMVILGGAPASASDPSDDVARNFDIDIVVNYDGTLSVTETYEWDFGHRAGLGMTRHLASHFHWEDDPDLARVYEYDNFTVSSPSGAPAQVWTEQEGAYLRVDIGAPEGSDDTRTGVQTYQLRYTVDGALNAVRDQSDAPDADELYWNVTGHHHDVPIESATAQITGPADITEGTCFEGSTGSDTECADLTVGSDRVTAASSGLDPNQGLTVAVAFPPGTFDDIDPTLEPMSSAVSEDIGAQRWVSRIAQVSDPLARVVTASIPLTAGVLVGLAALYGVRRMRRNRDLYYVDLPPGTLPVEGEQVRQEQLSREPVPAVWFEPPAGLRPAEAAVLQDKRATPKLVSVVLISLAARGYLSLHEHDGGMLRRRDWVLVYNQHAPGIEGLRPYEHSLLGALFSGRPSVKLSDLKRSRAPGLRKAKKRIREQVDRMGLFDQPLRGPANNVLGTLGMVGFGAGWFFFETPLWAPASLVPVTLTAAGLVALLLVAAGVTRRHAQARTAYGRALYERTRGFEHYLTTAEAHQIRFEEGRDIFSEYLPWAMAFGEAERWSQIMEAAAARGYPVHQPTWYRASGQFNAGSLSSIGKSMSSFSSSTVASTPGSSGGSGFGGGGSSGGGGGGGGVSGR